MITPPNSNSEKFWIKTALVLYSEVVRELGYQKELLTDEQIDTCEYFLNNFGICDECKKEGLMYHPYWTKPKPKLCHACLIKWEVTNND